MSEEKEKPGQSTPLQGLPSINTGRSEEDLPYTERVFSYRDPKDDKSLPQQYSLRELWAKQRQKPNREDGQGRE